jgi:hypothetical protein
MAQASQMSGTRSRADPPVTAPPACASTEESSETDHPPTDFVRGHVRPAVAPLPIAVAHLTLQDDGLYGETLLEHMQHFNHYAAMEVLGQILPDERDFDSLRPTETDQFVVRICEKSHAPFDEAETGNEARKFVAREAATC